jgi:hypothetical protein
MYNLPCGNFHQAQQHYLQISDIEFHASRALHVESTGSIHLFPQVKHGFPCTNFHENPQSHYKFMKTPPCAKGFSKLEKICRKYEQNLFYAPLSVGFTASIFTTLTNTVW